MITKKICLDTNAHIKNISAHIDSTLPQATVSFENLGFGTIKAIKLKAKGYNDFQDIITIGGKEEFFIVIQDQHFIFSLVLYYYIFLEKF